MSLELRDCREEKPQRKSALGIPHINITRGRSVKLRGLNLPSSQRRQGNIIVRKKLVKSQLS